MYTKESFRRCFFNPMEKNLLKTSPRLTELLPVEIEDDEPLAHQNQERLVRYVIALYDPKSPLQRDYPDIASRKVAASEVAGFDIGSEGEVLDIIYSCDSELLVTIIVNYLKTVVQSRLWAALQADEQTYWEFVMRLLLPISRGDKDRDMVTAVAVKTKLSEDKESICERLDRNWSRFIMDDEDLKRKVDKIISFTPEDMAGVR